MVRDHGRFRRLIGMIGLMVGLGGLSGCVERRYTIRTNPPGALVVVNGEEIGPSPVSRSYTYYGQREITLMLDGHQTQTIIQPMYAPWYDNYFTEFLSENMVPWTIRDEREFVYQMTPAVIPAQNDLLGRAEALRAIGSAPPPARPWGIREFVRNLFGYDVE